MRGNGGEGCGLQIELNKRKSELTSISPFQSIDNIDLARSKLASYAGKHQIKNDGGLGEIEKAVMGQNAYIY